MAPVNFNFKRSISISKMLFAAMLIIGSGCLFRAIGSVCQNLGALSIMRYYSERSLDSTDFVNKSIAYFETASKLDPGSAKGHRALGYSYLTIGLPELAIEEYEIAISLGGLEDSLLLFHLGLALEDQGQHLLAISAWQEAKTASYFRDLSQQSQDNEEKSEFATRVVEIDPDLPGGYYTLGVAYYHQGKAREAYRALAKEVANFELTGEKCSGATGRWVSQTYMQLGYLHFESGELEKAKAFFVRGLKCGHHDAMGTIALTLHRSGDLESALNLLKEAMLKSPNRWQDFAILGDIMLETGEVQPSLNAYLEAIRLAPESQTFRLTGKLATAYAIAGRCKEAWLTIEDAEQKDGERLEPSSIFLEHCSK